ncbi:MAG TPA: lysylphosphatidylglycerol synthase domain-containing protein [Cellvibrio sp.]|nr:lysylphosphatidylglycerol synthase domain-containing protein [Cellvibrio sp.]
MTSHYNALDEQNREKPQNKKLFWFKRLITIFFFILVPILLYTLLKKIEWQEVKETLLSYEVKTLLIGLLIALCSYIVFASYDLIGKKYTAHSIPAKQIIPLGAVCYAFNLNLSSWVGGIALRYRLYSRLGLEVSTITKVLTMSWITNWLGYMIIAGVIFSLGLLELPDSWKLGTTALQFIGVALIGVATTYLLACRFAKRRSLHIYNHEITLPDFRLSIVQAGLATLNWSLMGLLIFILLPDGKIGYPTILGILLISSIAGLITHIPAGLGVLEAIFITMLQHQLSKGTILAALIGYRILYFLIPLAIAIIIYLILESRAKKMRTSNNKNVDATVDKSTGQKHHANSTT